LEGWGIDVAVHPTGSWAVASTAGYGRRVLQLVDLQAWAVVQEILVPGAFMGLAWDGDGSRLYASGSSEDLVYAFDFTGDTLSLAASGDVPGWPLAVAWDPDLDLVLAASAVDRDLSLLDPETLERTDVVSLWSTPYEMVVLPDRDEVLVSAWDSAEVLVVDLVSRIVVDHIEVGKNPQGMALDPATGQVLVLNTDHDSLSVLDPETGVVLETVPTNPDSPDLFGSQPVEIALDAGDRRLYVPHAKENRVAVYSADTFELLGSIPTEWYPTAVALCPNCPGGPHLLVTTAKGTGTGPRMSGQSLRRMLRGSIGRIPVPDDVELAAMTEEAADANARPDTLHPASCPDDSFFPVPTGPGVSTPIEHVILLVRENKTYDSELGDLGVGNGDPDLVLFDETMTPNLRALARRFTLLDNYYQLGEDSMQGHNWTVYGMTNDYLERLNPFSDAFFFQFTVEDVGGVANPPIYKHLHDHGIEVTNMGEALGMFDMEGVLDLDFPGIVYNPSVKDEEKARYFASVIERGRLPAFTYLLLPNNHTVGTTPGSPTPQSMISDNDYATGLVVEALSRSAYWESSVIFLIEDDALQGGDHVAGHRSPCLVISPWARRGHISSVQASTPSLHRTIELIFGAPPMNRFDAGATPLYDAFTTEPDVEPYVALPRQIPDEVNPSNARYARESAQMEWRIPDQARGLDRILWAHFKGEDPPWALDEDGNPLPILFDADEAAEEREAYEAVLRYLEERGVEIPAGTPGTP
ncbi:MAG: bifunctional YncE family protein/alkaline phosphatase family protein, partial [Deltaproteobacteria bacterium]|nr:bifunctional YncE family protein/alkaline phosphatase family protein [Deltaproteobacteria bacterium]